MLDDFSLTLNVLKHQPAGSQAHRDALGDLASKLIAEGNAEAYKPALPFAIYGLYLCASGGSAEGQAACADFLHAFIEHLDEDFKVERTLALIEHGYREWRRDPQPSKESLAALRAQLQACWSNRDEGAPDWVAELSSWTPL